MEVRTFDSGATRDDNTDKLDYRGFLSSQALKAFAEYMHGHRKQADGTIRGSDNWKAGIPTDAYMESMWRHFWDVWDTYDNDADPGKLREALCALMFNVQGMLHEIVKEPKHLTVNLNSPLTVVDWVPEDDWADC